MLESAEKRKPPAAGIGRKKGVPNKLTRHARQAFEFAFDELGGAEGLATWAKGNPDGFYKLYARLLPRPTELSGKDGGPIRVQPMALDDETYRARIEQLLGDD